MTGEFITDSRARGCFIVIICNASTADVFRALQQNDSSVTHIEDIINVPPSTYTVYAYDLEEDALPNPFPANTTSSDTLTITTPRKKYVLVNPSVHAQHRLRCISVCLSVCSHFSKGIAQFYAKIMNRRFSVFNSWIFEKKIHSKVMVCKSMNTRLPQQCPVLLRRQCFDDRGF